MLFNENVDENQGDRHVQRENSRVREESNGHMMNATHKQLKLGEEGRREDIYA